VWLAVIWLTGLLAYSNTFSSPMVFDDFVQIVANPAVHSFDLPTLWWQFPTRIIPYLTLAANYSTGQLDVFGYHVVNLVVHLATAGLVYLLTYLLAGLTDLRKHSYLIAGAAALLFVSHPVQTQAVTYIVQRIASVAAMFYVLGLVLYIQARKLGGFNWLYVAAILAVVLGMFSKEIAFTMPIAIIMIEVFFFQKFSSGMSWLSYKRLLTRMLPIAMLMLIIPATLWVRQPRIVELSTMFEREAARSITAGTTDISRGQYLLTEFNVVRTYLRLMVLPVQQNLDYDYPLASSLWNARTMASLLLLLAIFGFGAWLYPRNRLASFGIIFFFLAVSVESSFIPIRDVIFEHRLYLPSVGFSLAVAAGFAYLLKRFPLYNKQLLTGGILVILVLSGGTFVRNKVWASELSLWQDVVNKSPDKARPHSNLGAAYVKLGEMSLAAEHLERAIEVDSEYAEAYNNLGLIKTKEGDLEEASELFTKSIHISPNYAHAVNNLGVALLKRGLLEPAVSELERAVRINSNYLDARVNLGVAYVEQGKMNLAEEQFRKVLEIDPVHVKAQLGLKILGTER